MKLPRKIKVLSSHFNCLTTMHAIQFCNLNTSTVSALKESNIDMIITDCFHINDDNIKQGVVAAIQVGNNETVFDVIEQYNYLCKRTIDKSLSVTNGQVCIALSILSANDSSFVLHIDTDPIVKNYLRSAFPLAVLQAANKDKADRFVLKQFIEVVFKPAYHWFDYHNYYYDHWDILDCRKMTKDIIAANNIDVIEYIITV